QEHRRTRLSQILDLFGEDSWRNVYAGELYVRPPGAHTTEPDLEGIRGGAVWRYAARTPVGLQEPRPLESMEASEPASDQVGFQRWPVRHQPLDHAVPRRFLRGQHAKKTVIKLVDGSAATSSQHEQLLRLIGAQCAKRIDPRPPSSR